MAQTGIRKLPPDVAATIDRLKKLQSMQAQQNNGA
jgi:hypothetical protein